MSDKKKAGSTIVSIKTNFLNYKYLIELFDDPTNSNYLLTEETANNFLDYVNSDAYDNSIIHRLVKDFVIQGGGLFMKKE